jgi:hypothetical protein
VKPPLTQKRLIELYAEYAPGVEDPALFVERALRRFPHGGCGLSALAMREEIGEGEIVQGGYEVPYVRRSGGKATWSVIVIPHAYLLVRNWLVVDLACAQHGGPEVYIGPLVPPWRRCF